MFVCIHYPINVKTAEPIKTQILWDLTWHQGRFMYDWIFKNLLLTKLDFWKSTKFFIKSAKFFFFVLQCTNEIEDGREGSDEFSLTMQLSSQGKVADHRGFFLLVELLFYKLFKKSQFIVSGESWKVVKEAFYLIEFVNPRNDWV